MLNRVALSFAPARLGKISALRGIYTMIYLLNTDACMAEGAEQVIEKICRFTIFIAK